MDSLYLLIPFSAVVVLGLVAVFGWALFGGQFDDLEREGSRILVGDAPHLDSDQSATATVAEECPRTP
jgi:cbb3-type cytochrome oxidase maturation protein